MSPARMDWPARDGADDRAGEVVLAGGVEAGEFGRLAAEKGHAVLLAGLAETGDDLLEDGSVELGGADVVHEEERARALHEDVVHAVVDDVLADGVVLLHHHGDLELGAHAVRGGDEQGVLGTALRKAAEPAERPDAADDICGLRRADQGLDGLERIHLVVDVDAGGGVGGFCGGRGTGHDFFSPCCCFAHEGGENWRNSTKFFF